MPESKRTFTKKAASLDEQINLLKSRGLSIKDEAQAKFYLKNIGYYRLSAYELPFQRGDHSETHHQFLPDTTFEQVLELYTFDRKLRLLVMDALERIEIAIKSFIINEMCIPYGAHWYMDRNHFVNGFDYDSFIKSIHKDIDHGKNSENVRNCAVSGKKVTCDLKKGKYIYLMTHDPANPSQKLWVKESVVMGQIREIFASFALSEEALPEMLTYVRKTHDMEKAFHQEHTRALHLEKNTLTGKLDRLTDLLLEGDITKEVYERKHQEITSRRDDINQQLAASDTGDAEVKMAISFIVSLVAKTTRLFESSKMEEKRKLLGLVFSNLQLEGSTLRYTLRKPFDLFAGTLNRQEWCAREDLNLRPPV